MTLSVLNIQFLVLLAFAIALRKFVPSKYYAIYGAAMSAAVIGFASPVTLFTIAGITLLYLYPLALLIQGAKRAGSAGLAKWMALGGVGGLVACMVLFKVHLNFTLPLFENAMAGYIVALVGFSYFLFRAINQTGATADVEA